MEYPTFFTGRARWLPSRSRQTPEMTVAHEAGHQCVVRHGRQQRVRARVDGRGDQHLPRLHVWSTEAFPTIAGSCATSAASCRGRFPTSPSRASTTIAWRAIATTPKPTSQATPSFRYWPSTASIMSYNKTALWLHTLERHLGWPMMQRIMSTFFQRWAFRHPQPADFFRIVNEVSGQDLTWFFDQVYRSSNTFDYGVQDLAERTAGRGHVSDDGHREALRRGDVSGRRPHHVRRWPSDHREVERARPARDLRLRPRVPRGTCAGRSAAGAAPGYRLHEQQPDARAAQRRGQPRSGRRGGWSGCRT